MKSLNRQFIGNKNALLVTITQFISSVCDKMLSIGLIWYLTKNFHISIVPWYLVASFLPHLIFSIHSSVIINRLGLMPTIIASSFFRGLILLIFFLMIQFSSPQESYFLMILFVSAFLIGVASSLFNPAILSLPPRIVPKELVLNLNALIDSTVSTSIILGSMCSVFLLSWMNIKYLILINSIAYFFSGILQLSIKEISKEHIQTDKILSELKPFQIINKYSNIKTMLSCFLFLNIFLSPLFVFIPWYVDKVYGESGSTLALIEGSMGVGAIASALLISLLGIEVKANYRIAMISIIGMIFGILYLVFSFSWLAWQGEVSMFLIGFFTTFLNIQVITYFQTSVDDFEVPAIMSMVNLISSASIPISLSISGLLFNYINIQSFAKICAAIIILIALFLPIILEREKWTKLVSQK